MKALALSSRVVVSIFLLRSTLALANSPVEGVTLEVCYDFGCRTESQIVLNNEEWNSVISLFKATSAAAERKQMKQAIARMEKLAGRYSPIHRDLAMNLPLAGTTADLFPGQLDCIDESINTTRFLKIFADEGLLRYHRVLKRAYRRSFLSQHWAAQIEQLDNGHRFVIDSWFDDNGKPPVLVSSERWHDLSL